MDGLPRSELPPCVQCYRPNHLGQPRRRLYEGRSNRFRDEARQVRELERVFLAPPPPSSLSSHSSAPAAAAAKHKAEAAVLSVSERQVRSGFRSAQEVQEMLQTRRALVRQELTLQQHMKGTSVGKEPMRGVASTTTTTQRAANAASVVPDATVCSMLNSFAPIRLGRDADTLGETLLTPHNATLGRIGSADRGSAAPSRDGALPDANGVRRGALHRTVATNEAITHPVVAALMRESRYGKGHTISAENFFLTEDEWYTTPKQTAAEKVDTSSDNHATNVAGGGPMQVHGAPQACGGGMLEYDAPDRSRFARNAVVTHHMHASQLYPCPAATAEHGSGDDDDDDDEGSCARTKEQAWRAQPPLLSADGPRQALRRRQRVQGARDADFLARREPWVAQYRPSVDPYKIEPCLGRCGRTDYHSTFALTQPMPNSSLFASGAERFRSVQHVPLPTPNMWQERARRDALAAKH